MPIVNLQRRLREVGRIRIGEQVPASNGKTRPAKLDHFRLTSRDQQIIEAAAGQYGGKVAPWTAPDGQQWEVKTNVDQMPVVVPPSEMAFSQFFEQWSAGGCKVRCDGEWDYLADKVCHCDPENRACAFHTRLSVMLPDLPGVGLWRLDTSGYYAATELAGVVDLCMAAAQRGTYLPARLRLEQRQVLRDGKTKKFAVPVLDVDVHPLSLTGQRPIGPSDAIGELPAGAFTPVPASLPSAPSPSIADQAAAVDDPAPRSRRSNSAEPLKPTGLKPRTASQAGAADTQTTTPAPTTTAAPTEGARLCARCQQPLTGPVEKVDGGYGHKGGCPPATDTSDQLPLDAPSEDQGLADVSSEPPADTEVYRDTDIHTLIGKVFEDVKNRTPRGQKTKVIDRLRHTLIWGITKGEKTSLNDLTAGEKHKLWTELSYLERGFNTFEVTDDALVISHGGQAVRIPFADENGAAA